MLGVELGDRTGVPVGQTNISREKARICLYGKIRFFNARPDLRILKFSRDNESEPL